jgi:hypothetical protein
VTINKCCKAITAVCRILLYITAIALGRYMAFINDNGNDSLAIAGVIMSIFTIIICFICMHFTREIETYNK